MTEPFFWLSLSLMLVAMSLTCVLIVVVPAVQDLARAGRSIEKLCDTLYREFPPTLEAIRLTGLDISELTEDLSEGIRSAADVVKQVDQGVLEAKQNLSRVQGGTRRLVSGVQAAWQTWSHYPAQQRSISNPPED